MRRPLAFFALLFALLLPAVEPAHALEDGLYGPGKLTLAGRRMRCGTVPTLVSKRYWMPAGSIPGLIGINPKKLKPYSRVEQWFIYTHECGHQHSGRSEAKADCYSARMGRKQGWLNRVGLAKVCNAVKGDPARDGYPSGRKRCEIMRSCFAKAG